MAASSKDGSRPPERELERSPPWPRRSRQSADRTPPSPPNPAYHQVGTGQEYQFTIDYTHLSRAPGNPATGGFVYAPGHPVAIWR